MKCAKPPGHGFNMPRQHHSPLRHQIWRSIPPALFLLLPIALISLFPSSSAQQTLEHQSQTHEEPQSVSAQERIILENVRNNLDHQSRTTPNALELCAHTQDNAPFVCDPHHLLPTATKDALVQLLQNIASGSPDRGFHQFQCQTSNSHNNGADSIPTRKVVEFNATDPTRITAHHNQILANPSMSPQDQVVLVGYKIAVLVLLSTSTITLLKTKPSSSILDAPPPPSPQKILNQFGHQLQTMWYVGDRGCYNGLVVVVSVRDESISLTATSGSASVTPQHLRPLSPLIEGLLEEMHGLIAQGLLDQALVTGITNLGQLLSSIRATFHGTFPGSAVATEAETPGITSFLSRLSSWAMKFQRKVLKSLGMCPLELCTHPMVILANAIRILGLFVVYSVLRRLSFIIHQYHETRNVLRRFDQLLKTQKSNTSKLFDATECPVCLQTFDTGFVTQTSCAMGCDESVGSILKVWDHDEKPRTPRTSMQRMRDFTATSDRGKWRLPDRRSALRIQTDDHAVSSKHILRCGHVFHVQCVRLLLRACFSSCPVCRMSVFPEDDPLIRNQSGLGV